MQTKRFIELIEEAYLKATSETAVVITVPYDPKPGDPSVDVAECLGIVLMEPIHMGEVAARACHIMVDHPDYADQLELDEALGDFADLMGTMRVLPYMHWHCAYFPGLTEAQVLASSETGDEPTLAEEIGKMDAMRFATDEDLEKATWRSAAPTVDHPVFDQVTKEIEEMRKLNSISQATFEGAIAWCQRHVADIVDYRENGMKIPDIADTAMALASGIKD
jgi:hypothetical protein